MDSSSTQEMNDTELMQARAHIFNHVCSFISSMSLKCAIQLDIPDIIHNHGKPITLSSLVDVLSLPPSKSHALYRLMRLLVHSGFFARQKIDQNQEEGYVLTPSSRLLVKEVNNKYSLSSYVTNLLDPSLLKPCHFLSDWFKGSGSTAFEAAYGVPFWSFMQEHFEYGKIFNEAMAVDSRLVLSVTVNDCSAVFENLSSLVDVGGGTGTAAQVISEAFPHLRCVVLDLPHVVADQLPKSINKNLDFIAGDMFESIPSANAVLLKNVLHDWGDSDCIKILKRCREAIPSREEGGKVIIMDIAVEDRKEEHATTETQLYYDMFMLTMYTTGKERTEKEWEKLFLESGFSDYKITPLKGFSSLIEVFP